MALSSRLKKLETLYFRAQPNSPNNSRQILFDTLEGTAAKLTGVEFLQVWCYGASNCELAGAAWLEIRSGTRSPALWQNVLNLSSHDGATGKRFSAILEQENGD